MAARVKEVQQQLQKEVDEFKKLQKGILFAFLKQHIFVFISNWN